MATIYIAFVECVLHPFGHWTRTTSRYSQFRANGDVYLPSGMHAELRMVDIGGNRRYFKFLDHNIEVRIINNVAVFDNNDVEELAVDDSAKSPKNKRIDE